MRTAIVTDSTADIPSELAQELHIHIIPNVLVMDGKSFTDGKDISREEYYRRIATMRSLPTTATASAGAYQELYTMLLTNGDDRVLSIHPASQLSGILNAASTAAQGFGGSVHVFDSGSVTLGMGFQVMEAARAALQGETLEAIIGRITQMRPRARIIAMLDTVEYLRRSGRVGWARARLGNLFQFKVFIELYDGVVRSMGEARTRKKGIERLKRMVLELGPLEHLAALHTNAEAEARQIVAEFGTNVPESPLVVNATTIIGTHVGPGALGFAAILAER